MLSQQPDQNEAAENEWDANLWQDQLPAARIATEGNASPQQVRSSEGRVLAITFARAGAVDRVDVTPRLEKVPNPYGIEGMDQEFYRVGIAHHLVASTRPVGIAHPTAL